MRENLREGAFAMHRSKYSVANLVECNSVADIEDSSFRVKL